MRKAAKPIILVLCLFSASTIAADGDRPCTAHDEELAVLRMYGYDVESTQPAKMDDVGSDETPTEASHSSAVDLSTVGQPEPPANN